MLNFERNYISFNYISRTSTMSINLIESLFYLLKLLIYLNPKIDQVLRTLKI